MDEKCIFCTHVRKVGMYVLAEGLPAASPRPRALRGSGMKVELVLQLQKK